MTICPQARISAVSMVTSLDFRTVSAVPASSALNSPVTDITANVCDLSRLLPNLRCLVLDGRVDFDMRRLKKFLDPLREAGQRPWKKIALLSLKDHPELGLPDIFHNGSLSGLVYLDVSCTGGWAHDLQYAQGFTHWNLPNLRVVKLSHMALDTVTVGQVLYDFPFQFWSLDLSGNKLDDLFVRALRTHGVRCDISSRLQHDEHFEVEGRLRRSDIVDSVYFVDESESSATFSHPLRYLADTPKYSSNDGDETRNRPHKPARLVGTERIRGDSVDDAITVLAGGIHDPVPVAAEWPGCVPPPGGLTHLHMNGLEVTLESIQSMLNSSSGYIEHFECDQARLISSSHGERWEWLSKAPWLSTGTVLYSFSGSAYLFRPVISSNLRVLKVHHSLVTNVPTVVSKSTSTLENIWVAEKVFQGPIDRAYPQSYVPDMNPRLYALTLAKIPRYSPGVVAKRIIHFLKLLAVQEQAIEQTKKLVPHSRGPLVVRGLRHICLEFEPDAQEEMDNLNTDDDVDEAIEAFSSFSFSDSAWDSTPTPPEPKHQPRRPSSGRRSSTASSTTTKTKTTTTVPAPPTTTTQQPPQPLPTTTDGRLNVFPFTATETAYYPLSLAPDHVVDVWIGTGTLGAPNTTLAVDAYMRALTLSGGRYVSGVTPATPCHVAAGVPAGSYLFGAAWHRLALPLGEAHAQAAIKRPTKAELAGGMRDVVKEIKAFRLASREVYARLVEEGNVSGEVGQHEYWKGRVEISLVKRRKEFEVMYGQ